MQPFIRECVESVLAQEDVDFEFIITDDGSTDGTAAILRSFLVIPEYASRPARQTSELVQLAFGFMNRLKAPIWR